MKWDIGTYRLWCFYRDGFLYHEDYYHEFFYYWSNKVKNLSGREWELYESQLSTSSPNSYKKFQEWKYNFKVEKLLND